MGFYISPRFKPWAKFKPWAIRLIMNRPNRFNGLGISGLILFFKRKRGNGTNSRRSTVR